MYDTSPLVLANGDSTPPNTPVYLGETRDGGAAVYNPAVDTHLHVSQSGDTELYDYVAQELVDAGWKPYVVRGDCGDADLAPCLRAARPIEDFDPAAAVVERFIEEDGPSVLLIDNPGLFTTPILGKGPQVPVAVRLREAVTEHSPAETGKVVVLREEFHPRDVNLYSALFSNTRAVELHRISIEKGYVETRVNRAVTGSFRPVTDVGR